MIALELEDAAVEVDRERECVVLRIDGRVHAFSPEKAYTLAMAILKQRAAVKRDRISPPTS